MPDKNIYPLCDRPLIAYSIDAARESRLLDDFLISTDSEEIAGVALEEGCGIPFVRPAEISTGESPTWMALKHAVDFYEKGKGKQVRCVVTLQPTTPLRKSDDIDKALELFKFHEDEFDCLISVCEVEHMHPLTLYTQEGRRGKPLVPGRNHTQRRQDWSKVLWRNGAVYITKRKLIMEGNRVVDERPLCYEMPVARSISIDNLYDLKIAELHMKYMEWLQGEDGKHQDADQAYKP